MRRFLARVYHHLGTRLGKTIVAVVVILVGARLAAPLVLEAVINDRLANLDGYRGRVEDVDLALWRGAYRIDGLRIVKTDGEVPVPFFRAETIDISVEWPALFDGRVVAEVALARPVINFVSDVSGGDGQAGGSADWASLADDLVPLTINRLEAHDGEIHYRDFHSQPRLDLTLGQVELLVRDLSTERTAEEMSATLSLHATAQSSGDLEVHARIDPFAEDPTFDLDLALRDLPAREINELLRAYVGVDAEAGRVFLYAELHAVEGSFEGAVTPMAEGLSIFRPGEEGSPIDVLGDALIGLVAEVFENHGADRLAARVPVSGRFEQVETDGWAAVGSVLHNAFISAIEHGIEHPTTWAAPRRRAERDRTERGGPA